MINKVLCLLLACALCMSSSALTESGPQKKIENIIRSYQPKMSVLEARKIAYYICDESAKHRLDPMIPTATAIVESGFTMHSRPQKGIMQFTASTWRSLYAVRGWSAMNTEHNVRAGVDYLARKFYYTTRRNSRGFYWPVASRHPDPRSRHPPESSLRRMWAGYNGTKQLHGRYVTKVLSVYKKITK